MMLSRKQQVWLAAYLTCWNGSEAARQAGYKHPGQAAAKLMAMPAIQDAIQDAIKAKMMHADEVLIRLAEQARASIAQFVIAGANDGFSLNWLAIQTNGHLVKSITATQHGPKLELYDSQAALVHIGKHLGIFKDAPLVNVNFDLDKWKSDREQRLKSIEGL